MTHVTLKFFLGLLVCILAVFGCACSESQVQKAKKVGAACQFAVDEVSRAIPLGVATGDLSADEAQALTLRVADVAKVVGEYNGFVRELKPNDRASPQRIAELAKSITDSLDRLHDHGVLQIKNQRARERLSRILFAARTIAGALSVILADAGYPAQGGSNGNPQSIQ